MKRYVINLIKGYQSRISLQSVTDDIIGVNFLQLHGISLPLSRSPNVEQIRFGSEERRSGHKTKVPLQNKRLGSKVPGTFFIPHTRVFSGVD